MEDNISLKPDLRYPRRVRPGRSSDVELRSPSFRDEHDLVRGSDVEPSSPSNCDETDLAVVDNVELRPLLSV